MLECESLSLMSRLILPVQRLPRYQMLLKALMKRTAADHVDYKPLGQAISLLEQAAEHIDENLKHIENKNYIYTIQNKLSGCPVRMAHSLLEYTEIKSYSKIPYIYLIA